MKEEKINAELFKLILLHDSVHDAWYDDDRKLFIKNLGILKRKVDAIIKLEKSGGK